MVCPWIEEHHFAQDTTRQEYESWRISLAEIGSLTITEGSLMFAADPRKNNIFNVPVANWRVISDHA